MGPPGDRRSPRGGRSVRPPPRRPRTDPPVAAPVARPSLRALPRRAVREELGRVAEIAGLAGFAVAQPVLGPFGESPETFVAAGASPADIVRFAVTVSLVPVVVLAALASATRLGGETVRRRVQTVLIAGLAALVATYVARLAGAGPVVRTIGAIGGAGAMAALHARWRPARLFLRYASPTPLLLLAAFLLATPVAPLVRPPSGAGGASGPSDLAPVVVVVLDELPTTSLMDGDGGVDADAFPNLARLAATSTFYRDHTAVASLTAASVPAILTGQLPRPGAGRSPVHPDHPDNLFTLLADTHEVRASEWTTALCPGDVCRDGAPAIDGRAAELVAGPVGAAPSAADRLLDEARSMWWGQVWPTVAPPDARYELAGPTDAEDLVRPALEFVSSLQPPTDPDRPVFDYFHAPLPHQPWRLLPSGASYVGEEPPPGVDDGRWTDGDVGAQLGAAARSRHLLQLQWTDRVLGAAIDRLEELGRWDDALVVVTSDHGVAFDGGGKLRVPTPENQVDIAWAPLFVKAPGQQVGALDDRPALAVDVVPTMVDLLGTEQGWDVDGRSLVSTPPEPGRPRPFLAVDLAPGMLQATEPGALADLDADGLAAVLDAGDRGTDPLRTWRHGRNGNLVGRAVADLGACDGGPGATYDPPPGWGEFRAGEADAGGELPLWHTAVVDAEGATDVAVSVDGVVAGWNVAAPGDGGATVGVLLAEPVVRDAIDRGAGGGVRFHQIVDEPDCRLRAIGA